MGPEASTHMRHRKKPSRGISNTWRHWEQRTNWSFEEVCHWARRRLGNEGKDRRTTAGLGAERRPSDLHSTLPATAYSTTVPKTETQKQKEGKELCTSQEAGSTAGGKVGTHTKLKSYITLELGKMKLRFKTQMFFSSEVWKETKPPRGQPRRGRSAATALAPQAYLVAMVHGGHDLPEEVPGLALAEPAPLADVVVQLPFAGVLHDDHDLVFVLEHCGGQRHTITPLIPQAPAG